MGVQLWTVSDPVLMRLDATFEHHFGGGAPDHTRPFSMCPELREEFIFSLIDIADVIQQRHSAEIALAHLREYDRESLKGYSSRNTSGEARLWHGLPFGRYLVCFSDLTLESPIGMVRTYFTRGLGKSTLTAAKLRKLGYKLLRSKRTGILSKLWPL